MVKQDKCSILKHIKVVSCRSFGASGALWCMCRLLFAEKHLCCSEFVDNTNREGSPKTAEKGLPNGRKFQPLYDCYRHPIQKSWLLNFRLWTFLDLVFFTWSKLSTNIICERETRKQMQAWTGCEEVTGQKSSLLCSPQLQFICGKQGNFFWTQLGFWLIFSLRHRDIFFVCRATVEMGQTLH